MSIDTGWLADLGQVVCVGLATWLGSDDYNERLHAKMSLYLVSQTGWRAPIEHALKSQDINTVSLAQDVCDELCNLWPPKNSLPYGCGATQAGTRPLQLLASPARTSLLDVYGHV